MKAAKAKPKSKGAALARPLVFFLLSILFIALAWAYLSDVQQPAGLAQEVDSALISSGVESRVTAVLLNFRAYDTLLECFVLFLAVVTVWSFRLSRDARPEPKVDVILESLVRLLIPLMVLVGGYLLWAGAEQAGGAFQSGAILGGAGVLFLLTASPLVQRLPQNLLVAGIALGPLFFLIIGVTAVVLGGNFLEYRLAAATKSIVLIEALAALSIGLSLAALFGGRRPAKPTEKIKKGGDQ